MACTVISNVDMGLCEYYTNQSRKIALESVNILCIQISTAFKTAMNVNIISDNSGRNIGT